MKSWKTNEQCDYTCPEATSFRFCADGGSFFSRVMKFVDLKSNGVSGKAVSILCFVTLVPPQTF